MAFAERDWDVPGAKPGDGPVRALAGWLGALSAVALVAGLGIWAWDLATRDAREVPVVQAMDGPARMAPEDPGGFEAAHQGFAVNRIASDAPEAPLAERVMLAPEPARPAPGDRPMGETAAAPDAPDPAAEAPPEAGSALRAAVQGALSRALAGPEDAAGGEAGSDAEASVPRPRARPAADIASRARPAPLLSEGTRATVIRAAAEVPARTPLAQLGAFDSKAAAEVRWDELAGRFDAYFARKARIVVAAERDGETVWRLRADGFDDLAAARNFCAVLQAEDADCLPVVTR